MKALKLIVVLSILGALAVSCAPQVVKETVVVEKPVEKVVKETVVVEKSVEKVVKETVVVEKSVEKVVTPTPEPAFDWRRYAGTKINVMFTTNLMGEYLESRVPDFEAATGIEVDFQLVEPGAMRDKQGVEFAAGSSSIDVWHTFLPQEGLKYYRAGWYEFVEPYLENPQLTPPDYDVADYGDFPLGRIEGHLVGIPMYSETNGLFYNKELLEGAGLEVPETMDEMKAAAAKVYDPDNEIYGFVSRGFSYYNTSTMCQVFFSMGAEWLDADGNANLDSPEAVAALEFYAGMMRDYGPPAPETLDFFRPADLFAAGKSLFYTDAPGMLARLTDPEGSQIVGKFDVARWPAGPGGSVANLGGWIMCIGKFSENKEAAWYYVAWHTSKAEALGVCVNTGIGPARKSVLDSPAYRAYVAKQVPGLLDAISNALENGRSDVYPPVEVAAEGRQLWGDAIVAVMTGTDAQEAAEEANRKFQAILDTER